MYISYIRHEYKFQKVRRTWNQEITRVLVRTLAASKALFTSAKLVSCARTASERREERAIRVSEREHIFDAEIGMFSKGGRGEEVSA